MKRNIILLLVVLLIPININAKEISTIDGYTNSKGVHFTEVEYSKLKEKFLLSTIDTMNEESKRLYLTNIDKIEFKNEYAATTEKLDKNGAVIGSVTIPVSKEKFELIKSNKNLHVDENGNIFNAANMSLSRDGEEYYKYKTSMKMIRMTYNHFAYTGTRILVEVKWYDAPAIKQYDVLAVRWNTSKPKSNVINYQAFQYAQDSNGNTINSQEYNLDGENMKRTTYGIGQSMNLFNTASKYEMSMEFELIEDVGEYAYATYQHARHSNANTLAISQAYSFSSNGLGGVLYYSNSTYRSYYDGMQGVYDDLSSGEHFE